MSPSSGQNAAQSRQAQRWHRRRDNWMLDQLPAWMLADDMFRRFVSVFQEISTTHMANVDQLEHDFDPALAPREMVQRMSRWVGFDMFNGNIDDDEHRNVLNELTTLTGWSGTAVGLRRLLELVVAAPVDIVHTGGVFRDGEAPGGPGHVAIRLPSTGWASERQLLDIVSNALPLSVTFELWLNDVQLWPTPPPTALAAAENAEEIICPVCGAPAPLCPGFMTADEFCPHCDFPLFWATDGQNSPAVVEYEHSEAHRRLPGVGGRTARSALICWACNEPNLVYDSDCLRCGVTLMPPIVPPPPPPAPLEDRTDGEQLPHSSDDHDQVAPLRANHWQCPQCGLGVEIVEFRGGADEFCPYCDFPLFWADNRPLT